MRFLLSQRRQNEYRLTDESSYILFLTFNIPASKENLTLNNASGDVLQRAGNHPGSIKKSFVVTALPSDDSHMYVSSH